VTWLKPCIFRMRLSFRFCFGLRIHADSGKEHRANCHQSGFHSI
jgi:hypothetical protein